MTHDAGQFHFEEVPALRRDTTLHPHDFFDQFFNVTLETDIPQNSLQLLAIPPHFANLVLAICQGTKYQLTAISEARKSSATAKTTGFGSSFSTRPQSN